LSKPKPERVGHRRISALRQTVKMVRSESSSTKSEKERIQWPTVWTQNQPPAAYSNLLTDTQHSTRFISAAKGRILKLALLCSFLLIVGLQISESQAWGAGHFSNGLSALVLGGGHLRLAG